MAELFLAQQPPKAELVVLKRILPYLSGEPEFVQMFLDEAKIAAQLHHPNIVQVYELGNLENTIFIAMEFVEGIDLRRVVQEESKFGANVPYGVAAAICAQVSAGLDYAHNSVAVDGRPLELIHRDVSPQNVMIAYDGRVKIVDFGIAKAGAFIDARSKPGVIKGKFLYLSPEQVSQQKLDHRADIFALGTMMYEITTGKSPFAKPTTEGILYAIRSEDPSPPHLLKDDYPQELSRIIMRCLVKDRELRYQRAAEVQEDLEAFIASGVLRQSTDIAEYIARLMGEEEERTLIHIPVAAPTGRKDATLAMPAGLAARPSRRPTGEGAAKPPDYGSEPEPPTQMGRPRELSSTRLERMPEPVEVMDEAPPSEGGANEAQEFQDVDAQVVESALDEARDFGEEQDESTAIGTIPSGFTRAEPGESTVAERGRGRTGVTPAAATVAPPHRRAGPPVDRDTEPRARRPATPPARRPLIDEDEDEESSRSISLTQPTLNQRPRRADNQGEGSVSVTPPAVSQRPGSRQFAKLQSRQEESIVDTESGLGEPELTGPAQMYDDPEDDESTAGYDNEPEAPAPRGSRGLVLAVAALVLLTLLVGGAFWALLSSPSEPSEDLGPPPAVPLSVPRAPPDSAAQAPPTAPEPDPEAGLEDPQAVALGAPAEDEAPPANPTGEPAEAPSDTSPEAAAPPGAVAAANTPAADTPAPAPEPVQPPPPSPAEPKGVAVRFKTHSTTAIIWVNGRKVDPNKLLHLPAGPIRVRFVCSTHRRPNKGSFLHTLKEGAKEPKEFSIPCRKGQR